MWPYPVVELPVDPASKGTQAEICFHFSPYLSKILRLNCAKQDLFGFFLHFKKLIWHIKSKPTSNICIVFSIGNKNTRKEKLSIL